MYNFQQRSFHHDFIDAAWIFLMQNLFLCILKKSEFSLLSFAYDN